MTIEQAMTLKQLHLKVVELKIKWTAAKVGSKSEKNLERLSQVAEEKFASFIDGLVRS